MSTSRVVPIIALVILLLGWAAVPQAADLPSVAVDTTPARVSYVNGDVWFWRPAIGEWTAAQLNTPLAPGDTLAAGTNGTVEVQTGPQAFVRGAAGSTVAIVAQDASVLELSVTGGHVAVDLREPSGRVVVDAPNAALTIDRPGYYDIDVATDVTAFGARRGGQASLTMAGNQSFALPPDQRALVSATAPARVTIDAAPAMSAWDQWSAARVDRLPAATTPYVPQTVYGASDLNAYGQWQSTPTYGPVWVPGDVAAGWVPYSTGRWIWDPRFGWTWLDDAPWGWAPYHYGRWVFVNGAWGWAPGFNGIRPVYAPALVVFLGGASVGRPVCWAPLAWGEPVIPWWGDPRFAGRPWWGGWGGPRVVNNVVVNRTTVVDARTINVYRNVHVAHAVVGVPADRFGTGRTRPTRIASADVPHLAPARPPAPRNTAALSPQRNVSPPPPQHGKSATVHPTWPSRTPDSTPPPSRPESPRPPQRERAGEPRREGPPAPSRPQSLGKPSDREPPSASPRTDQPARALETPPVRPPVREAPRNEPPTAPRNELSAPRSAPPAARRAEPPTSSRIEPPAPPRRIEPPTSSRIEPSAPPRATQPRAPVAAPPMMPPAPAPVAPRIDTPSRAPVPPPSGRDSQSATSLRMERRNAETGGRPTFSPAARVTVPAQPSSPTPSHSPRGNRAHDGTRPLTLP